VNQPEPPLLPDLQPICLRVSDAARLVGWSTRTLVRHLPYIRSYLVKRPGMKHGTRLIDYADFITYIKRSDEPK
jgi:hypothetical protein